MRQCMGVLIFKGIVEDRNVELEQLVSSLNVMVSSLNLIYLLASKLLYGKILQPGTGAFNPR
jgi:hypothetical protein